MAENAQAESAKACGEVPDLDSDALEWPGARIRTLTDAVLHAVIYADLFDYPLTAGEIHRYLPCYGVPKTAVDDCLARDKRLAEYLSTNSLYWFLVGRDHLVHLRREREAACKVLWDSTMRFSGLLASLPFVAMVGVTGALAANNASGPSDDIDLLIVSKTGRVWLTRGLAVLTVRAANRLGVHLCPNYVIAELSIELQPRNFYTARELAQLIPLHGWDVYQHILDVNAWIYHYFPNATANGARVSNNGIGLRTGQRFLELALGHQLGETLEHWEQRRKIPRLRQEAALRGGSGALFTPYVCKGHMDDHGAAILTRFASALAAQGL